MAKKLRQLRIVLSLEASNDLHDTLIWSYERFGRDAALRYQRLIVQALRDIEENPERLGPQERSDLQPA